MGGGSSRITSQDRYLPSSPRSFPPSFTLLTPTSRSAILDLKLQRDKLRIYQKKITTVLNAEHAAALSLLQRGDKQRALLALRRRKYQSSLLLQTDRQLETLEALTSSIEFALIEKDIVYGLKQGNEVLKQIHKEMTLEAVEKLMDETQEGIRYQKEVSEMLSGVMTNDDEDEVEEEMERLVREVGGWKEGEEEAAPAVEAAVPKLPDAPSTTPERARARKAAAVMG